MRAGTIQVSAGAGRAAGSMMAGSWSGGGMTPALPERFLILRVPEAFSLMLRAYRKVSGRPDLEMKDQQLDLEELLREIQAGNISGP